MANPNKKKTREPIVKSTGEPFDEFVKRVVRVPKSEVDRQMAAERRKRKRRRKLTPESFVSAVTIRAKPN
jgi:hypothetical protein